ncbi:Glycosyl transferases group 1 family protein (fragment) [Candidatus Desulfosporosinus infrequens]|uniref:Glycosyl transferases group 1 family protein n=1 Tax=Candidatus Desulfosporosinus infrequens TaxID=2043169 RepID=A0A2U3LLH9_9FIRM
MRIAYFTDTYLPQINGVSNTLKKLGDYLNAQDINHMFFAPQCNEKLVCSDNSPVARFKSISLPFYPECRLSIPLYANLCRIADKFKPDIIHLTDPLGIGLAPFILISMYILNITTWIT